MTTSLITGITGFVGHFLAQRLMELGGAVVGLDRWPACRIPGVAYRQIDILDVDALGAYLREVRPEHIYHLAAVTFLPDADATPRLALQTNIMGTASVLEAAAREVPAGRVLLVGSSKEYGQRLDNSAIAEESSPDPRNFYGISKYAAEMIGLQYHRQFGLDIRCTRSFNHTGPGQAPRFVCSDWARQIAGMILGRSALCIEVGDIREEIDFLDVRDVVEAYRCIIERGQAGGIYNVCSGTAVSLDYILSCLIRRAPAGTQIKAVDFRRRGKDPGMPMIGDNRHLQKTGWSRRIAIEKTLDDLVDYWLGELSGA